MWLNAVFVSNSLLMNGFGFDKEQIILIYLEQKRGMTRTKLHSVETRHVLGACSCVHFNSYSMYWCDFIMIYRIFCNITIFSHGMILWRFVTILFIMLCLDTVHCLKCANVTSTHQKIRLKPAYKTLNVHQAMDNTFLTHYHFCFFSFSSCTSMW